jgi:hypothetical protein
MTIENNEADSGASRSDAVLEARFPVLKPPPGCAAWVRLDALDEGWAQRVHGQTLKRLAERGGLCPEEIVWNLKRLKWGHKVTRDYAIALTNGIASNA